jgi:phage terminase large subunit-like protein
VLVLMAKQPRHKRTPQKPPPPLEPRPMKDLDAVLDRMTPDDWETVRATATPEMMEELQAMLARHEFRKTQLRLYSYYPETGPLCRELYYKHMEFYAAGAIHQERGIIAANRSGKSFCLTYEGALHMTGWYPDWWEGRRFNHPVVLWLAGEDAKAVRDSLQLKMLGVGGDDAAVSALTGGLGTGMIPFDNLIGKPTARAGVAGAFDTFNVMHASGGVSRGRFLTYDMGREAFQAATVDVVILDEEPPLPIYTEGLTRTMSTEPGKPNGIVMCGFTPLKGLSQVVLLYLPGGKLDDKPNQRS